MEPVKKRETSIIHETGGRRFKISRLSAYDGMYIGYTIMNNALPPMVAAMFAKEVPDAQMGNTPMTKAQFTALMRDVLGCIEEKLDAGLSPVLDESGNFAVIGLENDLGMVFELLVQALVFNYRDFFTEKLLPKLGAALGMTPPGTKT